RPATARPAGSPPIGGSSRALRRAASPSGPAAAGAGRCGRSLLVVLLFLPAELSRHPAPFHIARDLESRARIRVRSAGTPVAASVLPARSGLPRVVAGLPAVRFR